jgi:thiol:disulfide interchange protein DsbD
MKYLLLVLCLWLCAIPSHAGDALPGAGSNTALLSGAQPEFLPVEEAYPLAARISGGQIELQWDITPGYYLYKVRMGISLAGAGSAPTALDVAWPAGEPHEDEFLGATEIYRGRLEVTLPAAAPVPHDILVKSQGCADAGLCYPPRTQRFLVDPGKGTVTEAEAVEPPAALADAPAASPVAAPGGSLLTMVMFALLGGMILNLMPCVFPVLSLKVLGIAQKGGGAHDRIEHGLAYTAGVVISFLAVAAVLIALRQAGEAIGWGFHLQSPVFVGGLAYLFAAMGLGLSGVSNLGAGLMGAGSSLAARAGLAGSFFTGVLAAVVASPCSAPFMGTALGFAMTQPPAVALLVFGALGLGMALPFMALALSPSLLRRLPKPGAWMEGFKQVLAFPLYAAAVWLLWVLGRQSGVDALAAALGGTVLVAFALWSWESARGHARALLWRLLAAGSLVAALSILGSPLLHERPAQGGAITEGWEPFSAERLAALQQESKPVFVNVTADWCITCLANERVALETDAVRQAFRDRGVVLLKGDWTNAEPKLTAFLAQHGRNGVPLYLYYPPRTGALPVVLPQLLTPGTVLDALAL